MKFYFAGAESWTRELLESDVISGLFSFAYFGKKAFDGIGYFKNVFIDSGAFSVKMSGKILSIDDYCKFLCHLNDKRPLLGGVYANLDVIENAQGSFDNQRYMEKNYGLSPMPVFHTKEDYKWLELYCERYEYIALGGLGGKNNSKSYMQKHLDKCFTIIGKYWPRKIHGFAIGTSFDFLARYPFYSVDSTSWLQTLKFGTVVRFNRGGKQIRQTDRRNHYWLRYESDPSDRCKEGIRHILDIEARIKKIWQKRGITWND